MEFCNTFEETVPIQELNMLFMWVNYECVYTIPSFQISHLGRYQELKSINSTALQFLTCSEDGSVCIWDLNAHWSKRLYRKKPKRKTQNKFTACDVLSYKQLELLKPHYTVVRI
jgi:WD40 repeat protein